MQQQLLIIGIAVLFIGLILIIFASFLPQNKSESSKSNIQVGGFIGFIPFGSITKYPIVWVISVALALFYLIWFLRILK